MTNRFYYNIIELQRNNIKKNKEENEMTTTYGFKAMNADMTCRDYQFELGKTYQIDNEMPLKLCSESGFHFCLNFEDVFDYYNWHVSRVFKIKSETEVLTRSNKSITKEITILEEVTKQDIDFKKLKTDKAKNFYEFFLEDNEEIICNKFKNNAEWIIRKAVINKLSDEKLIFDTFKDDEDWAVRKAVVKKLSDEKLISYFKDDEHWSVRLAVVQKLSDEKLIFNTFKDDKYWIIREAVVKKLSDEQLIYSFKDDKHWWVRKAVIDKLSDENLIFNTFKDDKNWWVRKEVVKKLSDENLIFYFKDDDDLDVRQTVKDKLL